MLLQFDHKQNKKYYYFMGSNSWIQFDTEEALGSVLMSS